jgi:midasin (ATPase involved in ribosome maturation)
MARTVKISENTILLSEPIEVPRRTFIGRQIELQMCQVAWGINENGTNLIDSEVPPLHFRLQGAPGLGKNEIVYEIARKLNMPLYIIQGHEELTPEDLALLLTPDPEYAHNDSIPLILRASPLATALYDGGLFFFDEINRVPERALSPLSSVLDGRQYIYSAMAGVNIGPRNKEAKKRFRFCCALNPGLSHSGHVLPEYIEQRTLPIIEINYPPFEDLLAIIQTSLDPSPDFLEAFEEWYHQEENLEISVRQVLSLINYAMNYEAQVGGSKMGILHKISSFILGRQN